MISDYPISLIISQLDAKNLLPVIIFRSSRVACDTDLQRLGVKKRLELSAEKKAELLVSINRICEKLNVEKELFTNHPQFYQLINFGIAAHHAGQLITWRLLLEELMQRGELRALIATGTVAAGVDFPARSVIISSHGKRGNDGFGVLTSAEFQQMSGRAGRRGRDSVGFCLITPNPFCDARVLADVAKRPPEPLKSAYFASPSTVLNLLKFKSPDELFFLVDRSLAAFIERKNASKLKLEAEDVKAESNKYTGERKNKTEKKSRRLIREAESLEANQLNELKITLDGLTKLEYVSEGKLTVKGKWAANLHSNLILFIAESISNQFLLGLNLEELVGIIASIAGDSHRHYLSIKKNPIHKDKYEEMKKIVKHVHSLYEGPQSYQDLKVDPDAGLTVLMWMEAANWPEYSGILKLAGVAEGDVARLIGQTAEHLNQISRLTESHPELADLAKLARSAIMRPPITDAA